MGRSNLRPMKTRTLLALGALGAAALVPTTAEAQDAHGFGSQTQLIVSADRLVPAFSWSSVKETDSTNDNNSDRTSGTSTSPLFGADLGAGTVHSIPRVGVDFAVIPHLTIGGAIPLAFTLGGSRETKRVNGNTTTTTTTDSPSTSVIGIGPRVGYILTFGDSFGLWLRGGFSFYAVRTTVEDKNDNTNNRLTTKDSIFSLDLDPQFVIAPLEHFFINVGPLVNIPLTGSRTTETVTGNTTRSVDNDLAVWHIGIHAGLGGWFNL